VAQQAQQDNDRSGGLAVGRNHRDTGCKAGVRARYELSQALVTRAGNGGYRLGDGLGGRAGSNLAAAGVVGGKAALDTCLQTDRRVEVKVLGAR
jgi:hypothetical protein